MISKVLYLLQSGLRYIQLHPQFLFVIALLVVLPLLFLYVGNEFLSAGTANQTRLLKDRVGMLNDVLESQLLSDEFAILRVQTTIEAIAIKNPDIRKLRVLKREGNQIATIAALDNSVIGAVVPETEVELYNRAFVDDSNSLIFSYSDGLDTEYWQSFRAFITNDGQVIYIFTETSLAVYQTAFARSKMNAYVSLVYVYALVFGLAYWIYRTTDYRYLYQKAEKRIEMKDNFLNLMAHELRAPLTAMRGYASLIAESADVSAQHKEYANKIQKSTERLVDLVSDVLEVSRIQSGKLKIQFSQVSALSVLSDVVDELLAHAKSKGLYLELQNIDPNIIVSSDPRRLHQVLVNITNNSIKYTEKGGICVSVTDRRAFVEIRIKDTGVGIHAEDQKKLFAPFFRVQNESTNKITGSGLGMWITKELTELFGGTIGIESMSGVGTTVVIAVPKKAPKEKISD